MGLKTIFVAGGKGQVAQALERAIVPPDVRILTRGRPTFDILDRNAISRCLNELKPDLIVNAAAYTAVDQAESEEHLAFALNADAAGHLAEAASQANIPIIHISTDYVFDGSNNQPYVETDAVAPLGVYGRSKLAGEEAVISANPDHVVLRTAWVFSPGGKNFVRTMLRLAEDNRELRVVDDQLGNPTSAADIASTIISLATQIFSHKQMAKPGIYHMTSVGEATWFDFAEYIFQTSAALGGPEATVYRISSDDYPTAVRRPANSRLNCTKLAHAYGLQLPAWQKSTRVCVEQIIKAQEWTS